MNGPGVFLEFGHDLFGNELLEPFLDTALPDLRPELLILEGLRQEAVDPGIHRLDGACHRGVTGEHDPRDLGIHPADLDEGFEAVHPRHPVIGDDRLDLLTVVPNDVQRLLAVFRQHDPVSVLLQHPLQGAPDPLLVVDHQQTVHPSLLLQGSSTVTTVPFPSSLSTRI